MARDLRPPSSARAVVVCGSREWGEPEGLRGEARDPGVVEHELDISGAVVARLVQRYVPGLVLVTGAARGADTHAANAARILATGLPAAEGLDAWAADGELGPLPGDVTAMRSVLAEGLWLEEYPAEWDRLGKAAGPLRNDVMSYRAHEVIALYAAGHRPSPGFGRGGTNDMVRRAQLAGVPVWAYVASTRRWVELTE